MYLSDVNSLIAPQILPQIMSMSGGGLPDIMKIITIKFCGKLELAKLEAGAPFIRHFPPIFEH